MLDPRSWLDKAQALPEGRKRRTTHDCGDGKVLIVENKGDGWAAWCYRCHEPGWVPKVLSFAEKMQRLARQKDADEAVGNSIWLPTPFDREPSTWPLAARVWLYKAGLSNDDIRALGIYWHAPSERVVLPLMGDDGLPQYWQARDPFWTRASVRPKYLNPDVDKGKLVAKFGVGSPLVLTEDILSAYKVGKRTAAWALMGTSLKQSILHDIVTDGRPVGVWLDPDAAGISASTEIITALRAYGVDTRRIVSPKDPKLLSGQEIQRCLESCFSSSS